MISTITATVITIFFFFVYTDIPLLIIINSGFIIISLFVDVQPNFPAKFDLACMQKNPGLLWILAVRDFILY